VKASDLAVIGAYDAFQVLIQQSSQITESAVAVYHIFAAAHELQIPEGLFAPVSGNEDHLLRKIQTHLMDMALAVFRVIGKNKEGHIRYMFKHEGDPFMVSLIGACNTKSDVIPPPYMQRAGMGSLYLLHVFHVVGLVYGREYQLLT
jgi:hypothetical protein